MTQADTTGGIRVDILGCSDPFSRTGRSSTYRVSVGGRSLLVDCGAPIFHLLDFDDIRSLDGVVITHSHDDHRRWLTDLALFRYYVCRGTPRLKLLANERLQRELEEAGRHALQRSLSHDSRRMVDVPYDNFFETIDIGPRERYRMVKRSGEWRVVDRDGNVVDPSQAKVVVNPAVPKVRMLMRDPGTDAWVEPQIYYALGSQEFYETERNDYHDPGTGLRIRAIRSAQWHGMEVIGVVIEAGDERLVFSSDTAFNPEMFRELTDERLAPSRNGMSEETFEAAHVVTGDIHDFIERVWSEARYDEAMSDYREGVVFHDTAPFASIVHTDYKWARRIGESMVLVHTPDRFAATEVLGQHGKTMIVRDHTVYEEVDDQLLELDADVYLSEGDRYFVGYRDDAGDWLVVSKEHNLIEVVRHEDGPGEHEPLYRVALYEDLDGHYYPCLDDAEERYHVRPDGRVERQLFSKDGSVGKIVAPRPRRHAPDNEPAAEAGKKHSDTGIRTR